MKQFKMSSEHFFGELSGLKGPSGARVMGLGGGDDRLSNIEEYAEYYFLGGNTILNLKRHPKLNRDLYENLTRVRPPCIFAQLVRHDPFAQMSSSEPFEINLTPLPCLIDSVVGPARAMLVSVTLPSPPDYYFFEISLDSTDCSLTRQFFMDRKGRSEFVVYFPEVEKPTDIAYSVRVLNSQQRIRSTLRVSPAKKITFHLFFATHVDIGWTSRPAQAIQALEEMTARDAIQICDQFPLESELPFRWFCEGHWSFDVAYRAANESQKKRLEEMLLNGQIQVGGLPYTAHSHIGIGEQLLDFIAHRSEVLDRCGIHPQTGLVVDVPGATASLPELCAQAGMSNLFLGANSMMMAPKLPSFFNWKAPSGRQVFSHYCTTANIAVSASLVNDGVLFAEQLLHAPILQEFPELDRILLRRTYGENVGPIHAAKEMEGYLAWNKKFLWPRFECGGLDDYFEHVKGLSLDVQDFEGDMNDWWIEGVGSYPGAQSRFRSISRKTPTLETAGALLQRPVDTRLIYDQLNMHSEHTFGMNAISIQGRMHHLGETPEDFSQIEESWKDKEAYTLSALEHYNAAKGAVFKGLEDCITKDHDALVVLNPSARKESMHVQMRTSIKGTGFCTLQGEGGEEISGVYQDGSLSFVSPVLEPLSFTRFGIRWNSQSLLSSDSPVFHGHYVSLEVDTQNGGLRSLKSRSGRDWVQIDSPYGFGMISHTLWGASIPDEFSGFQRSHDQEGEYIPVLHSTKIRRGEGVFHVSQEFKGTGEPGAFSTYQMELTAWEDEPRIRIIYRLRDKDVTAAGESFSVNLPLGVETPEWNYDNGLSRLNFRTSIMPGSNYVDCPVASYLECSEKEERLVVIPHDSFLFQPGGWREFSRSSTPEEHPGLLRAMLLNNIWQTNFRIWHREDSTFTFDLYVGDPRSSWTLAESVLRDPPALCETGFVELPQNGPLCVDGDRIQTLSYISENGQCRLRLWEVSGESGSLAVIQFKHPKSVKSLKISLLNGDELATKTRKFQCGDQRVEIEFLPNEVLTINFEI